MNRPLVVRPQADLDLLGHCLYLASKQPTLAWKLRDAVQFSYQEIANRPRSGAAFELPNHSGLELRFCRPSGFKNYLVIYQVADDRVIVLRMLHASQDIETALRH